MDDKYPELKIADILANSATKLFKGNLCEKASLKLRKILKYSDIRHFNWNIMNLEIELPNTKQSNFIY
jgi:hypothetical protein